MRFRLPALPPLLQERTFRRYWTGRSLSLLGGQISLLAFPLTAVLVLKVGPIPMALLTAVGSVPALLFALPIGAVVDRRGRRRQVMILADLVRAGLLALIPAAFLAGLLSLPLLLSLWFAFGIFSVLFNAAQSAIFVAVVPGAQYAAASRLLSQARAGGYLLGPALAGWLIAVLTAPVALLADAFTFVASAVSLWSIDPKEAAAAPTGPHNVLGGLAHIRTSPVLSKMLAVDLTQGLFRASFMALYVLFGTRYLHLTPGQWGLILGPSSVLALLGSALSAAIGRRIGLWPSLVWGTMVQTFPLLVVPFAAGPHAVVVGMLFLAEGLAGAGSMLVEVPRATFLASEVPDAIRARVSSAFHMANTGMRPLGALLAAGLAWTAGVHVVLIAATTGMAASVLWFMLPTRPSLWGTGSEEGAVRS
jgi:hypothetical protein